MQAHQQRSNEWFDLRLGKFTASEIHKLLGKQGLGLTGETYCFEKASELVFGKDEEEEFTSFDMQRGISLEPLAFETFKQLKMYDFLDVKESYFFPYTEDAGASPDGLVGNDGILEIKCPKSKKFFRLISDGEKAIDKEYIAQMQMQMLCSNSNAAYFFNYIIFKGKPMYHEIIIKRDEEMISLIKERLKIAIKLRNEFVEYLINNQQF